MRYLIDLEQGIRDIEQKMMRLQTENTELIRELCETRTRNNDLRVSKQPAKSSVSPTSQKPRNNVTSQSRVDDPKSSGSRKPQSSRNAGGDGDALISTLLNANPEELGSLYEPFAAMWNLIRMDPSVVDGKVSAGTVLDRLRGMVEIGSARTD